MAARKPSRRRTKIKDGIYRLRDGRFQLDVLDPPCFASSWTPAMVRRWHANPFGFLGRWNEVPALMGSAPPATPPLDRHRRGHVCDGVSVGDLAASG
jgi:hypothetical protein